MNKKLNLIYLLIIAGIVVTSLILIKIYEIETYNLKHDVYDVFMTLMPFKIIILAIAFILMAVIFTFYKINKNSKNVILHDDENERLIKINEKLISLTKIDILTSLANEEYFKEIYEKEFSRATREKTSISLITVNIDDFKSYNDLYGEDKANWAMIEISTLIQKVLKRPCDFFARLQSDNFIILLPNTTNGLIVASRCLQGIEDLQILHENSIASNVLTVTAGVSTIYPTDKIQKEDLIANSNSALIQAKGQGRNRIMEVN